MAGAGVRRVMLIAVMVALDRGRLGSCSWSREVEHFTVREL